MKRISTFLIALSMLLTACASAAAPATSPAATAQPEATQAPAATAALPITGNDPATAYPAPGQAVTAAPGEMAATAETTAAPGAPAAGKTVYQIDPGQSKVSYAVDEVFFRENNRLNTAVGVTQGISGTVMIDKNNPQNSQLGPFSVDISQFKSDSGQRDRAIRGRFLQSSQYPLVTFVATQIEGLPASLQEGTDYPFQVTGDLTIRQTTKPVTFDVTARLNGNTLSGQALTQILMSDFGFGPIDLFGMLKTNDEVKVTFDFVAVSGK